MIGRIIENWLINTNESFIRTAFCQLLLNENHNVKNIHGNLEHGKDIISIDSDGNYNAYQLKKGDIDINIWRDIEPQINELIEYPIDHVGFDPEKNHTPYLVISGTVNSIANDAIRLYNQSKVKRGFSELIIMDKSELLKRFREAQGKFFPKELDDFYTFLDILTIDGTNFLPKKQLFEFLDHVAFNEVPYYRNDKLNAISSSLILMSYLLERFQESKNYYALFEAWIILAGCIIRFGKKVNLKNEDFSSSLDLIMENIIEILNLLKGEILTKKDFFEGKDAFDSSRTYGARVVITLGTLSCLELYNHHKNELYEKDSEFLELIKNNIDYAILWGESAFPFYFYLIKYLELNDEEELSNHLLEEMLSIIIEKNYYTNKSGLPDIYYDVDVAIESLIKLDIEDYIEKTQTSNDLMKMTEINLNKPFLNLFIEMNLGIHGLRNYLSGSPNNQIIKKIFKYNEKIVEELLDQKRKPIDSKLVLALEKILKYSDLNKLDYTIFPGSSYILESIVLMLSRRNKKQILTENWRKISHINFDIMEIRNIEDTFTWFTDGSNKIVIPKETQSWKELVNKASCPEIPEIYDEFFDILQFYILAVPHRINVDIIGLLDIKITH